MIGYMDEADSGLDVDALRTLSEGVRLFRERTHGSLLIVTHSAHTGSAVRRCGARYGKGRDHQKRRHWQTKSPKKGFASLQDD